MARWPDGCCFSLTFFDEEDEKWQKDLKPVSGDDEDSELA